MIDQARCLQQGACRCGMSVRDCPRADPKPESAASHRWRWGRTPDPPPTDHQSCFRATIFFPLPPLPRQRATASHKERNKAHRPERMASKGTSPRMAAPASEICGVNGIFSIFFFMVNSNSRLFSKKAVGSVDPTAYT
jgi:hypothetical protein